MEYNFDVKCLESGQRKSYGDSYYSYEVTSSQYENVVKSFCMNVLDKAYKFEDMPHPFAGKLLEFKVISESGDNKTYSYKLSKEYTG